jgi:hypothetical protein
MSGLLHVPADLAPERSVISGLQESSRRFGQKGKSIVSTCCVLNYRSAELRLNYYFEVDFYFASLKKLNNYN